MSDRVGEQEDGLCFAVNDCIYDQIVPIGIFAHPIHDAVGKFPKRIDMLLFAYGESDRQVVAKRAIASVREHSHLGEFVVKASLVGRKPATVKARREPFRLVLVVSAPWRRTESKNGRFTLPRTFAADLNIEPSQQVSVTRGYRVMALIDDDDPGLGDPCKFGATTTAVQGLDACDYHGWLIAFRRRGASLSTPEPHDAEVFAGLSHVDPELAKALDSLLAQFIGLRYPECSSTSISLQDEPHDSLGSDTRLASARRKAHHSSATTGAGVEK
jgi:hypothetical protein